MVLLKKIQGFVMETLSHIADTTFCQFLKLNNDIGYDPRWEKTFRGFANNTGADQPAHSRSLISAFAICLLEINIFRLATSEISIF